MIDQTKPGTTSPIATNTDQKQELDPAVLPRILKTGRAYVGFMATTTEMVVIVGGTTADASGLSKTIQVLDKNGKNTGIGEIKAVRAGYIIGDESLIDLPGEIAQAVFNHGKPVTQTASSITGDIPQCVELGEAGFIQPRKIGKAPKLEIIITLSHNGFIETFHGQRNESLSAALKTLIQISENSTNSLWLISIVELNPEDFTDCTFRDIRVHPQLALAKAALEDRMRAGIGPGNRIKNVETGKTGIVVIILSDGKTAIIQDETGKGGDAVPIKNLILAD